MFGYIGRMVQAKGFGWMADHFTKQYNCEVAWNIILWSIVGCAVIAVVLLGFTWKLKPKA